MVDDHVVEEPSDHEDIGLQGFHFNISSKVVRKGSSEPHLLMLIKLRPGNWISQFKMMNQKVDEENGKALNKGNVRY